MTRRIVVAIVAVTALAEVLFALPLGVTITHRLRDQDRLELTQLAALAASRVSGNRFVVSALPRPERAQRLGLYGRSGSLIDGQGPDRLDSPAAQTLADRVVETRANGWLVVTVPVVAGGSVQGLVRAAEPLAAGSSLVRGVWWQLTALAAAVLVLGALAAWALGRRLTRPLEKLGQDAARIGEGDFTVTAARTGLAEVDRVGRNLSRTAERVSSLFAREQAFTADASHQLRSPLTGLRLTLEAELAHPRADRRDAIDQALADVERLETTIQDLLALARDTASERSPVDLRRLLEDLEERWRTSFVGTGRRFTIDAAAPLRSPTVSASALAHVLDVLVDNARRHGGGDVVVGARDLPGAVGVSVIDYGPGVADPATVFQRRRSAAGRTGIGLALARRLMEAEGGRLRLREGGEGTRFEVTLRAADRLDSASKPATS